MPTSQALFPGSGGQSLKEPSECQTLQPPDKPTEHPQPTYRPPDWPTDPLTSRAHLDDLPLLEGQLLLGSIRVRGHGEGVVVEQSHEDAGREVLNPRVRLWTLVEVWGEQVPPTGAIWGPGSSWSAYPDPLQARHTGRHVL